MVKIKSPQLEDGYTRIANEILELMAQIKLSPTQYRILFVIWRYTYGFNRKSHDLSLSFIAEALDCPVRSVQRDLKRLIDSNIVIEYPSKKLTRKLGFNKRFQSWSIDGFDNGKVSTDDKTDNGKIVNDNSGTDDKTDIRSDDKTDIQERKYLKTYIKTSNLEPVVIERVENEFKEVNKLFAKCFGSLPNSIHHETINSYLDDGLKIWHITKALEITFENKKNSFAYTRGVLNNWLSKKAFTKEQVEKINKSFTQPPKNTQVFDDNYEYTERSKPATDFFGWLEPEEEKP